MPIHFRIEDNSISKEDFDDLSRAFANEAKNEGIPIAPQSETPASPGEGRRGDPITLGVFALALVTRGSIVALFNLLKSYLERSEELSIEFARKNGSPVKLSMKNVSLEKFKEVIAQIEKEHA